MDGRPIKRDIVRTKKFKIVMVGDPGVGKTAFLQRFIENSFTGEETTAPTLGWEFKVKAVSVDRPPNEKSDAILEDKELVHLYVWDTAS